MSTITAVVHCILLTQVITSQQITSKQTLELHSRLFYPDIFNQHIFTIVENFIRKCVHLQGRYNMWSIQFTSWHSFFVSHHESESSWILMNMLIFWSAWQWNIRFFTPRLNKRCRKWMERKSVPTCKVSGKLSMIRWCCDHAMWPAKCDFRLSSIIQGISVRSRTHTNLNHGVFLCTSKIGLYIFLLQASSFFKVQLSQLLVTEGMVANVTNKWKFNNSSMVTSDALLVLG